VGSLPREIFQYPANALRAHLSRESEGKVCQFGGEKVPDQGEVGGTARQDGEVEGGK